MKAQLKSVNARLYCSKNNYYPNSKDPCQCYKCLGLEFDNCGNCQVKLQDSGYYDSNLMRPKSAYNTNPTEYYSLCRKCFGQFYFCFATKCAIHERFKVSNFKALQNITLNIGREYYLHREELESVILNHRKYKGKYKTLQQLEDGLKKDAEDQLKRKQEALKSTVEAALDPDTLDLHPNLKAFYKQELQNPTYDPRYSRDYLEGLMFLYDTDIYKRLNDFCQGCCIPNDFIVKKAVKYYIEDHGQAELPVYLLNIHKYGVHKSKDDELEAVACAWGD